MVSVFFLASCAARGPVFKAESTLKNGMATVYIYRPWQFFNAAGWPDIFLNEKEMFALKNEGYGVLHLEPGEYTITADGSSMLNNWYPSPVKLTLNVVANSEYYIRVTPQNDGTVAMGNTMIVSGSAQIIIVQKERAIKEIVATKKVN